MKDPILTWGWWQAAFIRAFRTFAQTMVALIGTGLVSWHEVPWMMVLSTALVAALLSVLTSVATGLPEERHEATTLSGYTPKHATPDGEV